MMRLLKWALFFCISFFISWIVIATFSQPAFREAVPVRIVLHETRKIPIYYFIAIAFFLGLALGLTIAVYNFITLKAQVMKKENQVQQLANMDIEPEYDGGGVMNAGEQERFFDEHLAPPDRKAAGTKDDEE